MDLLRAVPMALSVDFSTQCNLRCSYCHTGTAAHVNIDMTEELLVQIHGYCHDVGLRNVWLSASGETTMYANWREKLAIFLTDPYFVLSINSNFARIFTDEDIRSLLRFAEIQISIDSAKPEMLKKQRGAELRTVIYNIVRLRSAILETGSKTQLRFNCTLTRDNVTHVEGLARLAAQLGISELLLSEAIDVPENPRMPDTLQKLTDDEALAFGRSVWGAIRVLHGTTTQLQIQDTLKAKLSPVAIALELGGPTVDSGQYFRAEQARVTTSPCMQGWNTVVVVANGDVRPCCGSFESLGNAKETSLIDIVDGPKARAFRQMLIDGGPDIPCTKCHLATRLPRETVLEQVGALQAEYERHRERKRAPLGVG